MGRLPSFVEQIDDVDHINLFLTDLGCAIPYRKSVIVSNLSIRRGTQHPQAIASLCDAIRLELERKDVTRFVKSILTAYVVKTPPDHEAGLGLLLRLRGQTSLNNCQSRPLPTYLPMYRQ
jgi:elongator complex protein 1